jgi:hypothetical protein
VAAEVNGPAKPDLAKVKAIMLQHGLVPASAGRRSPLSMSEAALQSRS